MRLRQRTIWLAVLCLLGLPGTGLLAHVTPPVVLLSERDAVLGMTSGATKFFVREVRLTSQERAAIEQQWRWRPEDELYRFYLGRDNAGSLVTAVIFLTEATIHGPVRVAVGLGPDGAVKDARVVELTEETFPWLQPLLDQNFTRDYIGRGSQASFGLPERLGGATPNSMSQFYGQIVSSLIQRATVLFEVTVLKRGEKI